MPEFKNIVFISFLGAALFLLLPPIVLIGIATQGELIEVIFQFLTGWIVLGIYIYYQSKFFLKYRNWLKVIGLGSILLVIITGVDVLINLYLPWSNSKNTQPPIPGIPDSVVQNIILFIISNIYVYQFSQRKKNEENLLQLVQLQKENLQLQLNSLQQQLNPHFFFNSLNTLSELIYIDVEKSESYINELSQVFRYILNMQQKTLIQLEEELKFIESYFYLLKIRFEDKLHLRYQIENPQSYKIPSLSLLVLFENVIKHNAISTQNPMQIRLQLHDNYLSVTNNKNPMPIFNRESLGVGLENLKNRCELLTNEPCIIEDLAQSFTVKIPLIRDDEYNHN